MNWLIHLLGVDYGLPYGHFSWYNLWSGFGSDVGEVSIVSGLISLVRRNGRRHMETLAQAAQQHREKMQADAVRHDELVAQADRHHQEQLDRQDVHAAAIQAHVTATAAQAKDRVRAAAGGERM